MLLVVARNEHGGPGSGPRRERRTESFGRADRWLDCSRRKGPPLPASERCTTTRSTRGSKPAMSLTLTRHPLRRRHAGGHRPRSPGHISPVVDVVIHLPIAAAILADAATWAAWSALMGLVGARWAATRIGRDGPLLTLRPFESGGSLYRRLGIRRWKSWLPDAGRFAGGRPKGLDRRLDPVEWRALAAETRRAERVHWLILLALPVTALWSRGLLLGAMVAYAAVANGPCIAAQRYNRLRLIALMSHGR